MIRANPIFIDENSGVTPQTKAHDRGLTVRSSQGVTKNHILGQSKRQRKALGELSDTKLNARKQNIFQDPSSNNKIRIPYGHESQSFTKNKSKDIVTTSIPANAQRDQAATKVIVENSEGIDEVLQCTFYT